MAGNTPYVDSTRRPIRHTGYARMRMSQRYIRQDDVWFVLAHHDSDQPSSHADTPERRETVGDAGRRLLVVIEATEHDTEGDQAYVTLSSGTYGTTKRLDAKRWIDVSVNGAPLGVDFAGVSKGVDLTGIPDAAAIAEALGEHGITVLQPAS